jgi:methylated-DNA-[protein]-cysteine S-methyltransferase
MENNIEQVQFITFSTPLGDMLAFANTKTLVGLYFDDQKTTLQKKLLQHSNTKTKAILKDTQKQLTEFFNKKRHAFSLPYQLSGTAFQQKVWQALSLVPFGKTISYKELAQKIGKPNAIRAVAQSVARNPLLIVLPCHRIIGSNGALIGFAAGITRKKALLALEKTPKPSLALK